MTYSHISFLYTRPPYKSTCLPSESWILLCSKIISIDALRAASCLDLLGHPCLLRCLSLSVLRSGRTSGSWLEGVERRELGDTGEQE
mmetsp:Transcript_33445/g.75027  ORF Transcript_33445/g.75027 Transcript_33445/m.75027 type:complete len:87 (+) Transcript_33445:2342-2602(+)